MKEKILIIGDTHGDISLIKKGITLGLHHECKRIIQVGDFGFFPKIYPEFISSFSSPLPFFFIDGNHDDHSILPHSSLNIVDVQTLGFSCHNLFYIPRGYLQRWGESNILFMGGAQSVDKIYRTQGIDWWSNEEINPKDFNTALSYRNLYPSIDLLITHECPRTEAINYPGEKQDYSSRAISELIEVYNPSLLIHGHHHQSYLIKYKDTIIKGLGCNPNDMFELIWI